MSEHFSAANTLIPSIAYGDSFGLAAEGKSAEEIRERYGKITELIAPVAHPFFPYETVGVTSDDTQLSVAVAEGLINAGGFSLSAQAERHIAIYRETPQIRDSEGVLLARGWGKSTIQALENLMDGVAPEQAGFKGGAGNGVVMKMAPLALWQTVQGIERRVRYEQDDALTTMTHDSDIARFCTRLHGDVLDALLTGDGQLDTIVNGAIKDIEQDFPRESQLLLRAVADPCASFDELVERYAEGKSGKRYGFYVPETLAISYDILFGSGGDFKTAVEWAANLGGDADSTASIVASMIACSTDGTFEKPYDFTEVQKYDELLRVSAELEQIAQK